MPEKKLASKITNELVSDYEIKEKSLNRDEYTEGWKGRIIVLNPQESEFAKKLNLTQKGEFAIKTR